MKTVSIVTINDFTNYGNRLQNLALSYLLESKGFRVINGFSYYTKDEWCRSSKTIWKKLIRKMIPYYIFKKRYESHKLPLTGIIKERYDSFVSYYKDYYSIETQIIAPNIKKVKEIIKQKKIDYFVVGSDQVWNPYFACFDYELLTAAPNKKKYSFAASFGVDEKDIKNRNRITQNLITFRYLSVREQSAVEIIKSFTGKTPDLTFDPTLLLTQEEWNTFVRVPKFSLPSRYICTYFLGDIPNNFLDFAKKEKLSIVALNDPKNTELYAANPGVFLYLIKNSEYVFTDSFHAIAFSIKFHKNFCVFNRKQDKAKNMFTRIESILSILSLSDRIYSENFDFYSRISQNKWNEIDNTLADAKEITFIGLANAGMEP